MDPCLLKNLFLARRLRIQNPARCVKIGPVQHPNTQATLKWYKIQYQNAMKCCWIVKTLAFETFRNFWNSKINSIFVKKEGKKQKKNMFSDTPTSLISPLQPQPSKMTKKTVDSRPLGSSANHRGPGVPGTPWRCKIKLSPPSGTRTRWGL